MYNILLNIYLYSFYGVFPFEFRLGKEVQTHLKKFPLYLRFIVFMNITSDEYFQVPKQFDIWPGNMLYVPADLNDLKEFIIHPLFWGQYSVYTFVTYVLYFLLQSMFGNIPQAEKTYLCIRLHEFKISTFFPISTCSYTSWLMSHNIYHTINLQRYLKRATC